MKTSPFFGLVSAGCAVLAVSLAAGRAAPRALPLPQSQMVSCSSDDMKRHTCAADTSGGVQLIQQHSGSPCDFGRTWGYGQNGIWVDRGCRADFQVGARNWNGWGQSYLVFCASENGDYQFCPADTGGGVRIARQRSGAACEYGRSWGFNRQGIWVNGGCAADFELGNTSWNPPASEQRVTCSSDDMGLHYCAADTTHGVRLLRQISGSDCIYGTTWGYDERGIWVNRGCRADFDIGGGDNDHDGDDQPYTVRIYCASDDMHRHSCATGRNGGVRMARQRSGSPCDEGRTWGYDRQTIWVDRGCRADFQVAMGGQTRSNPQGSSLYCASDDNRRHYCQADTSRGVRLVRQRSGSPCIEGRTWGYDQNGIWVDRGCRADFQIGNPY